MTKQSGLGDSLYIDGYDISGDIQALGRVGGGHAVDDVTGIDKLAHERIGLVRDGGIEAATFFNPETAADDPGVTADRLHVVLKSLPTSDRIVTYGRGTALGKPGANLVSKQLNYDLTRGDNGELRTATQAQANGYGLEWGIRLTDGKRIDTGAANGASVDTAAALSFGGQAYLHVFGFTGTDCTITVQDSADDSSFAAVSGLAFTAVTSAPTTQRIAASTATTTLRRYLRVATSTTGGFSSVTFAVFVIKNEVEVTF